VVDWTALGCPSFLLLLLSLLQRCSLCLSYDDWNIVKFFLQSIWHWFGEAVFWMGAAIHFYWHGLLQVWDLRSLRIYTTWSRRLWLCASIWRGTARIKTQSSALFSLRVASTAWPAITSAPRSSHPTGSSECLDAFWCCIRFLGAIDELTMSVDEMYVSYRNVFACDGFLNFHACLLLTFPCLSVCAVSLLLPAPWLLNRCRWKFWVQEMICSLVSAFNQFEIRFCFWGLPHMLFDT